MASMKIATKSLSLIGLILGFIAFSFYLVINFTWTFNLFLWIVLVDTYTSLVINLELT
jgi:hypothetical protein